MSTQTLASLRKSLKDYIPASSGHQELKAVLTLFIDIEPQTSNEEYISGLKEELPVEMILKKDVLCSIRTGNSIQIIA